MEYTLKDLRYIQEYKMKESIDSVPIVFNYLYIFQTEVICIQKVRKKYKVLCSPQCHEVASYEQAVFDVVYETESLEQAKIEFHKCVFRSIRRHSGW